MEIKKTYVVAVLIGMTSAAKAMGWITDSMAETLIGLLVGGGFATLRLGLASEAKKTEVQVEKVAAQVEKVETKVETVAADVATTPNPKLGRR